MENIFKIQNLQKGQRKSNYEKRVCSLQTQFHEVGLTLIKIINNTSLRKVSILHLE